MIEKKMVLEAQANQKSLDEARIQTEFKDGIVTASILNESGKRIELHDQEAINLAFDVQTKQNAMKKELEDLTTQLSAKLDAQTQNISATQDLYQKFNKNLKEETANTAKDMIKSLSEVNRQLRETIALKAQAGVSSGNS
jgi:hypothetical protein